MSRRSLISTLITAYARAERSRIRLEKRYSKQALRAARQSFKLNERSAKQENKRATEASAIREVEAFEASLRELAVFHLEHLPACDWGQEYASLPPVPPIPITRQTDTAKAIFVQRVAGERDALDQILAIAKAADVKETEAREQDFAISFQDWEHSHSLARGILDGNCDAYQQVLKELEAFSDLVDQGCIVAPCKVQKRAIAFSMAVRYPSPIIPVETKSLTSTNKLSVKPMPKAQTNEIFQEIVASMALRVGIDCFALLPVDFVIITAGRSLIDDRDVETPFFSVVVSRDMAVDLDKSPQTPATILNRFQIRSDFKASRRDNPFAEIDPFRLSDLPMSPRVGITDVLAHASAVITSMVELREELANPPPTVSLLP